MGISGVQFSANGRLTSHRNPGSFSDNVYDAGSAGAVSAGNAVIIGESTGGDPFTLYCFGSDGAAGEVLGSGALREGVRAAFNPGGGYKPQKIYAMSVNTKTKASLELSNCMKLIAGMYGIRGNNLSFKFEKDDSQNKFSVRLKNKLEKVLDLTDCSHNPMCITNETEDSIDVRINNQALTITLRKIIEGEEAIASEGNLNEVKFSAVDGRDYTIEFTVDDTATDVTCEYSENYYKVTMLSTSNLDEILSAINTANPNTFISSTSESIAEGGLTGTVYLTGGTIGTTEEEQSETIEFSFETYSTVEELTEAITETLSDVGVSATLEDVAKSSDLSCNLDSVVRTINSGDFVVLSSNYNHLKNLLQATGLIEVDDTEMDEKILPDTMQSFSSLTGGGNGECGVEQYVTALGLLKKENIQLISTTSEDESVHLLIKQHCEECNSRTGKRERQAIVGGAWGEDVSKITSRAKMLGSEFVALCSPGYHDYDYTDPLRKRMKQYSSAYYACKMLGQQAAMDIGEPSTKKEVSHFGWEKEYSDVEIDTLIENGVWCGEKETDEYGTTRFQTARSITTSKEDNVLLVEFSVIREELYMSRDLRAAINAKTIGVKGLDSLTASQETKVRQRLNDFQRRGFLRKWDKNSVKVIPDGDVTKIEWSGCPAVPNNFNFITNNYTVYRPNSEDN